MTKWKLALGATTVLAAGAALFVSTRGGTDRAAAAPPAFAMPVPVTDVVKKTLPIFLEYSARTESIRNVGLQAKISGYVQEQPVGDGADVEKDTLLYRIDARDYRAALDQAKAQHQRDAAALEYASALAQRGGELAKSGALAKDMMEQRVSGMKQAEALLAADEAAVRQAENNLAYTEIRAPFAGRFGRNKAAVGTLITANSVALNTIVQLDPIYVTFAPSESDLAEIQKSRSGGQLEAEVLLPGETAGSAPPWHAYFHRQCRRLQYGHARGPRHHRQQGLLSASGTICPRPAARKGSAGRAACAAGSRRFESDGKVSLRGWRRQQSGAPARDAWAC